MLAYLALLLASVHTPTRCAGAVDILSPGTHAQTESTVGFSYVFAEESIRSAIAERLNALDAGLAAAVGDVAGSGSDTLRVTYVSGIGWQEEMAPMTTETEAIVPTGYSLGLDEVTIGRYGLAKEQSYQDQGIQRPGSSVSLDRLIAEVPNSFLKTVRGLIADTAATFATAVGMSGDAWDLDDELALIASFGETDGFDPAIHRPRTLRAPKQYTQFRNALRNEPGFQGDAQLMQALMGLADKAAGGAFNFLGFQNFSSVDVATSGGDYIGGAWVPGAIMYAVMSPASIRSANPSSRIVIPEYGILIDEVTEGGIATGRFNSNCWIGFDAVAAALAPQFKIRSVTT